MNYFINNTEEINLIKFIAKYQYLRIANCKYFFSSKKYYRNRVNNLISKRFLKKSKWLLTLGELGIAYVKSFKFEYNQQNRNSKYLSRLLYLSDLGAFYHNSNTIQFIPSFAMKDKEMYTITARRYIGVLEISGIDYLAYHITNEHDNKYITSVIYDIQKEKKYKNIIVFVNDISRIDMNSFAFGMNKVLIIQDDVIHREKLKYLHRINWLEIIEKIYKERLFFNEYNFCDYTDYENKYISTFYFIDTEKINRIKCFLRESKNRNIDIICSEEIKNKMQTEIPNANYIIVDLENYIDKEQKVYD